MKWRARMEEWRWLVILWLRRVGANPRGVKGGSYGGVGVFWWWRDTTMLAPTWGLLEGGLGGWWRWVQGRLCGGDEGRFWREKWRH